MGNTTGSSQHSDEAKKGPTHTLSSAFGDNSALSGPAYKPPSWKHPEGTLDPEKRRWRDRSEIVYQKMVERCSRVVKFPHLDELVEVVHEDKVPYAEDFFRYFPHYAHETRSQHEGLLGEYYSSHIFPHLGSAFRMGSSSEYCLILPFQCEKPRAGYADRETSEMFTREKAILTLTAPWEATSNLFQTVYPSKRNHDTFTIAPPEETTAG
eukprot:TRINITY_DN17101_c0_g1_i1.p1 TRINITY_DN17101_c0_g1~~TRINITY_DN17101_c0_g1_i1.p1  ORF type:complete len:223 (+),score=23.30 TRINITY_DN17101_c0_g1_i1:42-671(+)